MPVVKDLVPDMTHFYAQYASIKPWIRTQTAPPPDAERLQSKPGPRQARRFVRMYTFVRAARPRARATGGTATNTWARRCCWQAYRWIADSRDEDTGARLDELEDPFKLLSLPYHHELHQDLSEGAETRPRRLGRSRS